MPRKVRENMREPPFAGRLSDYQRMTMLRREYSRRYGMSATVHRLLITIGSFFGGLGGGLTLAQVQPPDIVLMDIGLPGINGIEATRRIMALAPQAKVTMLSIHEDPEYQADAAAAGASAYVPKRTMHRDLIPAVERLLSHAETPLESDPAPGEERRGERQDDA